MSYETWSLRQMVTLGEIGASTWVGTMCVVVTNEIPLPLNSTQMRYIIETGLLQARLLNRTLVIPSYLYARSCEWEA